MGAQKQVAATEPAKVRALLTLIQGELTKNGAPKLDGLNLEEVASDLVAGIPQQLRSEWDELIGPFYSTSALEVRLGVTRQALSKARKTRRLLATPTGNRTVLYPTFQFAGSRGVTMLPHLREVLELLEAASMDDWSMALWLKTNRPELDGAAPYLLLRGSSDDVQMVLDLAADDARRRAAA